MKISNRKKRKIRQRDKLRIPTIWTLSNKDLVSLKIASMVINSLINTEVEKRKKKIEEKKE